MKLFGATRFITVLSISLLIIGCGGGGSSSGGGSAAPAAGGGGAPTTGGGGGAPLTAQEQANLNAVVASVFQNWFNQLAASFNASLTASPTLSAQIVRGSAQGSVPCPGGGSWSGGASGSFDTDTNFVKGQGQGSSHECISADGQFNLTGNVFGQGSGTCPGTIGVRVSGSVEVSRRGSGGGWVPVQSSIGFGPDFQVNC
jgi:hypothetical protein